MREVKRTIHEKEAIQYLDREEKKKSTKRRELIINTDIFTGEFVIYDMG